MMKIILILFLIFPSLTLASTDSDCSAQLNNTNPISTKSEVLLDPNIMKQRILSSGRKGQFLVGFQQDSLGRIQPIWSEAAHFLSLRYVPHSGGIFGAKGWNDLRESVLVGLDFHHQKESRIYKSTEQVFPENLKVLLKQGLVPETNYQKIYPSYEVISDLIKTDEDLANKSWNVLMVAASPNPDEAMTKMEGRTGVTLYGGIPMIRKFASGHEQILEAKGIGLPEGGFKKPIRATHLNISGGISYESSKREFYVSGKLSDITEVSVPLIVNFVREYGAQGLVFRWTSGTRRSSFIYNPRSSAPFFMEKYAKELSQYIGKTVAQVMIRGFVPRIHMENLVVSENPWRANLTDFNDILPLAKFFSFDWDTDKLFDMIDILINKNEYNLSTRFDKKEFLRGLVEECDRAGLPKISFEPELADGLRQDKVIYSKQSELYIKFASDVNIQYVLQRLLPVGIVKSMAGREAVILHNLDVEQITNKLEDSLSEGKNEFTQLREQSIIIRSQLFGGRPDEYETNILTDYENARVRNDLGWSMEGARKKFSQPQFRDSYRNYLASFALNYSSENYEPKFFIEGSIEKIPELKTIIDIQKELIMRLDILWNAYKHMSDKIMAERYYKKLTELLNCDPIEFLEKYQAKVRN
ncbi:MAG: hypothetical protein H6625_07000 [Bdellovibrionaceae bacterium]|nr:hypothetical protein [Pseudobdellovibrionaceae bacterium]